MRNQEESRPIHHGDDEDDRPSNPSKGPVFQDVAQEMLSRRGFLKGVVAASSAAAVSGVLGGCVSSSPSTLGFPEVPHGLDEELHTPDAHQAEVVIRWGDPLLPGAPDFDPWKQSAKAQSMQFGYNNDFLAFMPLPAGSQNSDHGLLVSNHEYTAGDMMFPGSPKPEEETREQVNAGMMAHGLSVVEIRKDGLGRWNTVQGSRFARRITPHTVMQLEGPAAGHQRVKTRDCPDGRKVFGTFGNCAGGVTPWGTIITAEENIQKCFMGDPNDDPEAESLKRFGFKNKKIWRAWGKYHERFLLGKVPRTPNHYGWLVEIDPYDPTSVPRKHTALGRFKHEGCGLVIDPKTQRVVAYSGDDQRFEYVYRFVSEGAFNPDDRKANMTLLDQGTLSVARFESDGRLRWLPLVFGQGPLTKENGFASQADVVIDARRAADLLGATPMDRPEDVEVNPVTGSVFVMLTLNDKRTEAQRNAPNPRANNLGGQIVELVAPGLDHTADVFHWDFLLLAGDPNKKEQRARYHQDISENGWFYAPDNCAFDRKGRIWIATDGSGKQGIADGIWACDVRGPGRALTRRFLAAPVGAEVCGPCFTPDNRTFFCAIQHPGEKSSFDRPSTRWPDFDPTMPPRPAVVAITRRDGGVIGEE